MKKRISLPVFLLSIFLAALVSFQCTYIALSAAYEDELTALKQENNAYAKLDYIRMLVSNSYLYRADVDDSYLEHFLADEYLQYYLGDIYSDYYTPEEFAQLMYESDGKLVGIGVSVVYSEKDHTIEILYPMDGSPAKEAGLEPGDHLIAVDGVSLDELTYEEAVNRIRGEVGTQVTVTIARTAKDGNVSEFDVTLARAEVDSQSVLWSLAEADPAVGLIRILQFDGGTPAQFKNALSDLKSKGVTKLIFDLRGNPGGDSTSVEAVLDEIILKGHIATLYDVNGATWDSLDATNLNCITMPMAVIADENTASAGELFTQTLKDYEVATVVGTVTYGKGVGQSIFQLPDGSGVRFTTCYYDPPKSGNYNGIGVIPHVTVELPEEYLYVHTLKIPQSEDTQLIAALAAVNGEKQ